MSAETPRELEGHDGLDPVVLNDDQIEDVRTLFGFQARNVVRTASERGPRRIMTMVLALRPLARFGLPGEPIDDEMREPLDAEEVRAIRDAGFYVAQWALQVRNNVPSKARYYDKLYRLSDELTRVTGGAQRLDEWLQQYADSQEDGP